MRAGVSRAAITPGFVEFELSMSHPAPTPASVVSPPNWTDPQRQQAFETWLQQQTLAHSLDPRSVRAASADASFRRYFRVDSAHGTRIIMDAPPEKENCETATQCALKLLPHFPSPCQIATP